MRVRLMSMATTLERTAAAVWFTMDGPSSRAFAEMTRAAPQTDAAAALDQAGPGFVRQLRCAAAAQSPVIVAGWLWADPAPPLTPYDGVVDPGASRRAILTLRAILVSLG